MDDAIEFEAGELEGTAWWRSQKAEEYPDDPRNAEAVVMLERLAKGLRSATVPIAKQIVIQFSAISEFVLSEGEDEDERHELGRRWNEYRSRIGFSNFPDSAEEYLTALVDIARDVAPAAPYLLGD
jgi:hypothetical protein